MKWSGLSCLVVGAGAAMVIDAHAHICDEVFDQDRDKVLAKASDAGISSIIAVGETMADAIKNLLLAAVHPMIKPAAGLYPSYCNLDSAIEMADFIRRNKEKLFAIGEVGLDYWLIKEESEREIQRKIFGIFIELSKELNLPLNVHSRSAGKHAVDFLLQHSADRVQLHAFDGKASSTLPAIEAGYFFSIPPSIVRSEQKQKLVKRLPLSSMLVETDSPVLGPIPQERNEPANAILAIREIARLKEISEQEVIEAVSENAQRLYRK
jgi:TatD DNase family protein